LENEGDFEFIVKKYPQIEKFLSIFPDYSLIFEITTPNLKICIDYGIKPEIWLIGFIRKYDYFLVEQEDLDILAEDQGFKRPETFKFDSIPKLLEEIKEKKSGEGVCVYSGGGQVIHKVKSARYLLLHRLKSQLSSFEKILDLFFDLGKPTEEKFLEYIAAHFDFEIVESVKGNVKLCCEAWLKLEQDLLLLEGTVGQLKLSGLDRKGMAIQISTWGELKSIGFSRLDNKEIDDKVLKRIIISRSV